MRQIDDLIWVTEFPNWHSRNDGAQTVLAEQDARMTDMVAILETRSDVSCQAWFTSPD